MCWVPFSFSSFWFLAGLSKKQSTGAGRAGEQPTRRHAARRGRLARRCNSCRPKTASSVYYPNMLQRSSEWVGLKKKLHERQQTPTLVSEREIWWATSEAPRVKAVGRVAKPLKPATARDPGRHGQPCQIANKSKGTPARSLSTEPAPSADPKAVTPTTQPSQATNGAFGFVQNAVNSLTSAPAKLLGWGRIETGSRP